MVAQTHDFVHQSLVLLSVTERDIHMFANSDPLLLIKI